MCTTRTDRRTDAGTGMSGGGAGGTCPAGHRTRARALGHRARTAGTSASWRGQIVGEEGLHFLFIANVKQLM